MEGRAVFVREQGVVVLGRGARRVLFPLPRGANAKDPVWSPDGASVAFAYAPPRPGSTPATVPEPPTQAFASDLMAVGADGSGARVLVAHDRPGVILDGPAWGPDGRTLYFGYYAPLYQGDSLAGAVSEIRRRDPWEIWSVGTAGGSPRRVTWLDEDSPGAAWSTDGRRLLVQGQGGVYIVDAATGAARRVSDSGAHGGVDWRE